MFGTKQGEQEYAGGKNGMKTGENPEKIGREGGHGES
jgi:hypothetical protein